jgi:hypothetical protein
MRITHTLAGLLSAGLALSNGIAFAQIPTDESDPTDAAREAASTFHGEAPLTVQIVRGRGLPVGTTIEGEMDNTVATGAVRPGDVFTVTIRSPIVDEHGRPALPGGARLVGRIVDAYQATEANEDSRLRIAIDGLGVRGEVLPMSARITHLEPSVSIRSDDNTKRARILSGTRVAVVLTDFIPFAQIEGVAQGAVGGGPVIR